jgi:hypothetical protein
MEGLGALIHAVLHVGAEPPAGLLKRVANEVSGRSAGTGVLRWTGILRQGELLLEDCVEKSGQAQAALQ